MLTKNRVLTGIRPTGPLHLGHYVGALKQWIPLQKDYECFFLIADWQAMTTHADSPDLIAQSVIQVVRDWISVGLNPHKNNVHFVLQSQVPELNILYTLLSMVTPKSWIDQNPTIKAETATLKHAMTLGFFDYPVSQGADILMVSTPNANSLSPKILVPVGEDQIPHLEATNRIARAFNRQYKRNVFTECEPLVGTVGRLVGTNGQEKMSKSQGNAIFLADSSEIVRKKVMSMFTDPKRVRADIPGDVDNNPVFIYLDAFGTKKHLPQIEEYKERYRKGTVGDVEVKKFLFFVLEEFLNPIRERRKNANNEDIGAILRSGSRQARKLAGITLKSALSASGLNYDVLKQRSK